MLQQDFCPVQSSRRLFLCIHINSSSHETWKNQTKKRKFESFDRQISQLHGHCVEIWQRKSAGIYKYSVLLCVYCVCIYTQLSGAVVSSCVDRVCVWYIREERSKGTAPCFHSVRLCLPNGTVYKRSRSLKTSLFLCVCVCSSPSSCVCLYVCIFTKQ